MRLISRLRYLYLAYFSKPVSDRALYRAIWRRGARKILEIGIGTPERSIRMIELARRASGGEAVRYVAIDLFEARAPQGAQSLPLKEAHRLLHASGANVQLVPGDPTSALKRTANSLGKIDLVVLAACHDAKSLEGAWFYLPRLMHDGTVVLLESVTEGSGELSFSQLSPAEIESRGNTTRRRAA